MKTRAVSMVLLMIASALAGCTSGDPDGDGEMGIDTDMLNDLIEDNLQDFINNSSVTVHQTIHYHNNTTYVVDDGDYSTTNHAHFNNTTNVDGGEINNYDQSETTYNIGGASFGEGVNGSVSGGSMMFVAHVTFTAMDLFPDYEEEDHRNNEFNYTYTYYDYLTNSERTDNFQYSCQVFYLIGSQSNNSTFQVSYWENNNYYWDAWDNEYNSTVADMLSYAASDHDVRMSCDEDYIATMPIKDGSDGWNYNFLSIDLPQGYAIEYIQLSASHSWTGCWDWLWSSDCTDSYDHRYRQNNNFYNFTQGSEPWNQDLLFGGWENLTIEFDLKFNNCDEEDHYRCENPQSSSDYYSQYYGYGYGGYSVWPTSEYEFTLYYRFVPVIPVE